MTTKTVKQKEKWDRLLEEFHAALRAGEWAAALRERMEAFFGEMAAKRGSDRPTPAGPCSACGLSSRASPGQS
jgi:hypothetical protein